MLGVLAVDQPDLFYARQQMAFSLGAHIVIACIGMSVPFLVVIAEWKGQRTGDIVYATLARRWAKAVGVLFAVGAVSGTILSFEFGILWPRWMGRFGDVMGLPFAIEGFAFFLEAIFIGIYLYGWDKLPPRVHLWAGVPIGIAGVASAFFVVAANGWMNDPTGFTLDASGNVTHVDPWAAMFNSALWPEAIHMILAAFIVGGCLVAMPYGWAMLRGRRTRYERVGLLLPLTVAMIAAPVQIVVGDWAARHVAVHQPEKLAAMEGLYNTTKGAPLEIGGIFVDNKVKGGHLDSRRSVDPRVPQSQRRGERAELGGAGRPRAGERRARRVPTHGRDRNRDARPRPVDAARLAPTALGSPVAVVPARGRARGSGFGHRTRVRDGSPRKWAASRGSSGT